MQTGVVVVHCVQNTAAQSSDLRSTLRDGFVCLSEAMSLIKNAIDSIAPRRTASAIRNFFTGVLLLLKEKLRQESPADSNERFSKISDTRGQTDKFCKNAADHPRKCDSIPKTDEAAENYFTIRIENGDKCIAVRKDENGSCLDGGNQGHRDQVDEAERGRRNCYDELNTRKGNGGIYTVLGLDVFVAIEHIEQCVQLVGQGLRGLVQGCQRSQLS